MKYLPYLTIAILLLILSFKTCQTNSSTSLPNSKQLVKQAYKQEADITHEIKAAKVIHDTIVKERHHYHQVRHDSLIPCETKLIICDTLLVHDSILDIRKDTIISDLNGLVGMWKRVHAVDSIAIKKGFWKGFKVGFITGNITGGGTVWSIKR